MVSRPRLKDLSNAMRKAVRQDTLDQLRDVPMCIACGEDNPLYLQGDHVRLRFYQIRNLFIEAHGYPAVGESEDTGYIQMSTLREEWVAFHRAKAILQTLCGDCHKAKDHAPLHSPI